MRFRTATASLLIVLAVVSVAWAAEQDVGTPKDKTDSGMTLKKIDDGGPQISEVIAAFEKCFNRGDAKELAALWKPDGYFSGPHGERIFGRKDIEAAFQTFFAANKNCKLKLAVLGGRPVTNDVAVVDVMADMTPAPEGAEGEPRSTIVFVLHEGHWLIDSVRETISSAHTRYPKHLKDLEWMVGDWTGAAAGSSDVSMRSTCDWTANHSYMIRKFSVGGKSGERGGTEVIGWDPRAHRIRSWVFEADGGFGESVWTHDGDRWTIKYNGVLADGSDVSATRILTRVDANTLTLESTDRLNNGQKRPDVAKVTIKRSPAKDGPKAEPAKPPRDVLP